VLLTKLKTREAYLAHAQQALARGWSRNVLALHIEQRYVRRRQVQLEERKARFETRRVSNLDNLWSRGDQHARPFRDAGIDRVAQLQRRWLDSLSITMVL